MKIKEIDPSVGALVWWNGGYCPCAIDRTPDTRCPCREFREAKDGTVCHCGRYQKEPECGKK